MANKTMNDFLYVLPSTNQAEALALLCKPFDWLPTQGAISLRGKRARKVKDISAYIPDLTSFLAYARTAVSLSSICRQFRIPDGGDYTNGISLVLEKHNIPKPVFKQVKQFVPLKKECPQCKTEFVIERKSDDATCCSRSCSNSYFRELRYSEVSNEKRRQATYRNLSQTEGPFYEARLALQKKYELDLYRKSMS